MSTLDRPDPGRADDLGKRVLDRITWEWQLLEPLIISLVPAVPPGKALRTYGQRSAKSKGIKPEWSDEEKIASGARTLINARLATHQNSGRVLIEKRGDERWVKLNERRIAGVAPGETCPTCGHRFSEPSESRDITSERHSVDTPPRSVMKDAWARAAIVELSNNDQTHRALLNELAEHVTTTETRLEAIDSSLTEVVDQLRKLLQAGDASEALEVLGLEIKDAQSRIAGLVESSVQLRGDVDGVQGAIVTLVSRLTGALTAKDIFTMAKWPEDRK